MYGIGDIRLQPIHPLNKLRHSNAMAWYVTVWYDTVWYGKRCYQSIRLNVVVFWSSFSLIVMERSNVWLRRWADSSTALELPGSGSVARGTMTQSTVPRKIVRMLTM